MSITQSIELFTAINLAVIGLSHFLQPKMWVHFFIFLHAKREIGNIFNALIALSMGSFILSLHFVWTGPEIVVTIYGLLQVIKGLLYLIWPSIGLASIRKVNMENGNKFRWVGLVMFVFSLAIFYLLAKGNS